jgi:hypothetical protein
MRPGHCETKLETNRLTQKRSMIQKVLNITVALMNTGALVAEMRTISTPKIGKLMVVLQFGAYWMFMWYLVT